jgi:hypothetical protein
METRKLWSALVDDFRTFELPVPNVLQFTNVPRPTVGSELFERALADMPDVLTSFFCITPNEILGEYRNVLSSLAERGYGNRKDIESVEKTFAEYSGSDGGR